jgi:hypothetical protein
VSQLPIISIDQGKPYGPFEFKLAMLILPAVGTRIRERLATFSDGLIFEDGRGILNTRLSLYLRDVCGRDLYRTGATMVNYQ